MTYIVGSLNPSMWSLVIARNMSVNVCGLTGQHYYLHSCTRKFGVYENTSSLALNCTWTKWIWLRFLPCVPVQILLLINLLFFQEYVPGRFFLINFLFSVSSVGDVATSVNKAYLRILNFVFDFRKLFVLSLQLFFWMIFWRSNW